MESNQNRNQFSDCNTTGHPVTSWKVTKTGTNSVTVTQLTSSKLGQCNFGAALTVAHMCATTEKALHSFEETRREQLNQT